jgi:chromosome segregation ATPase
MTIDERIDKLVERHEALTMTVELDHREFREAIREFRQWNGEFRENFADTAKAIADLRFLAESHEQRLDDVGHRIKLENERQDRLDARVDSFAASVETMRQEFAARLKRLEK